MALTKTQTLILKELLSNRLSVDEIAEKVGCSHEYIYLLIAGKAEDCNQREFSDRLNEIDTLVEERTNRRALQARELLYKRLHSWAKRTTSCDTKTTHKMMVDAINALTKATPQFNVEQYTWKSGLNEEEVINEFRRLKGLAERAADRRRVPRAGTTGAEQIPLRDEPGDGASEAEQDSVLPSQSKTEEIPRKRGSDKSHFRRE